MVPSARTWGDGAVMGYGAVLGAGAVRGDGAGSGTTLEVDARDALWLAARLGRVARGAIMSSVSSLSEPRNVFHSMYRAVSSSLAAMSRSVQTSILRSVWTNSQFGSHKYPGSFKYLVKLERRTSLASI